MVLSSLGAIVTVVNRVVDEQGQKVPYEAYVDGTVMKIVDSAPVPAGVARIIVHNSMYAIDPVTYSGQYKLGVKEWGLPVEDLPLPTVQRLELVERAHLGPHRQFGATDPKTGKKYTPYRLRNDIRRHDPITQTMPGPRQDGAFPGGFGDAFANTK
jgi:hypothetical protein